MRPLIFCVDPALGRLEYTMMSQQALMEILIEGINRNKKEIHRHITTFPDITEWEGVDLDKDGDVVEVNFSSMNLGGMIDLQWLPPRVRSLWLNENSLEGTIDMRKLPNDLDHMVLYKNTFSGSLDLEHLPEKLTWLYLSDNSFSGSVILTRLPKSLARFSLHNNLLSGSIDLTNLPGLEALYLNDNDFSGDTDFDHLPKSLRDLDVSNTKLSGTLRVPEDVIEYKTDRSDVCRVDS